MATAVISLAASVIGGLLALAGQWLTRRSEDRRYWRRLLRDAADLATSFSQERAILTSDRRRGNPTSSCQRWGHSAAREHRMGETDSFVDSVRDNISTTYLLLAIEYLSTAKAHFRARAAAPRNGTPGT